MSAVQITAESYSYETAAAATGFSQDVIKRAVKAGDLEVRFVRVDDRPPEVGDGRDHGRCAHGPAAEWSA